MLVVLPVSLYRQSLFRNMSSFRFLFFLPQHSTFFSSIRYSFDFWFYYTPHSHHFDNLLLDLFPADPTDDAGMQRGDLEPWFITLPLQMMPSLLFSAEDGVRRTKKKVRGTFFPSIRPTTPLCGEETLNLGSRISSAA